MAKGTKTGGKPFAAGNPGRPKGAKDKISRGLIRDALAKIAKEDPALVHAAVRDSLRDKRSRVAMLGVIAKVEGEKLDVTGEVTVNTRVIHEHIPA